MLPAPADIASERARRSLHCFLELMWPQMCPADRFVSGWHIAAICDHLEAVVRGHITRLLINVPPRHGKSLITSVALPAWAWITHPQLRWLFASYGIELAFRDSVLTRRLIESPAYQQRWGHCYQISGDQQARNRLGTSGGGARLATSVGGAATGEGGDIIVIDDPHKIEHATSTPLRQASLDWFDQVISTRLNDPKTSRIVIIGQRLHQADLFGHLLEQGGWTHLCLPAEYDPSHPFCWPDDPRTTPGELLWPNRFGPAEIAELGQRLGSYGAAGQLQQLPSPAGGGILHRSWWRYWDAHGPPAQFENLFQSWDLTFTGNPGSDYVVGQVWGTVGAQKYLLHQVRDRLDFPQTITAIRELTNWVCERYPGWGGHAIIIENTANGAAAIATLKTEVSSIISVIPQGDKASRVYAISAQVEAGNVHLPGRANADHSSYDPAATPQWVQRFVEEAATFPHGAHDDQVDAMSQALIRAAHRGPRIRVINGGFPTLGTPSRRF